MYVSPIIQDVFQPVHKADTKFTKITSDYVSTIELPNGESMLKVCMSCTNDRSLNQ